MISKILNSRGSQDIVDIINWFNIYKKKGGRPPLDECILKTWIDSYPELKHIINDYKSALNYRNWLAHGRYWVPKLGRKYDIDIIYSISDNIISNIINIS